MGKYIHAPKPIEAITFNELVAHGLKAEGVVTVEGLPLEIEYKGQHITFEGPDCYMVPTEKGIKPFCREEMLVTGPDGDIYPMSKARFEQQYEKADD